MPNLPIRGRDITGDELLDRLYKAWISHKIEDLELRERYVLERMEFIDALLKEGGERSRYKNIVEDTYQYFKKDHDVSRRTIESDIARAKRFFLSARPREDKEYARGKSIEWLERLLWKAEEVCDFKAAAVLMRELNEIQGFKKEDIDKPDYTLLQPAPIMIITDPTEIGVPVIDNLEEELRILSMPKSEKRNTEQFETAEDADGSE